MGRCRFVQPDVVRLPLSDGDFLNVRRELTIGELQSSFESIFTAMHFGEKADVSPSKYARYKILAYITDWSLTDSTGQPVLFSESALKSLDIDTYREIENAIDAHDDKATAEREARKNVQATGIESPATSPSAVI